MFLLLLILYTAAYLAFLHLKLMVDKIIDKGLISTVIVKN